MCREETLFTALFFSEPWRPWGFTAQAFSMCSEKQACGKRSHPPPLTHPGVSKPAESSVDKGRAHEQRQIDQFLGVATPPGADPRGRRPGAPARTAAAAGARPGAAPEWFAGNLVLMSTGI